MKQRRAAGETSSIYVGVIWPKGSDRKWHAKIKSRGREEALGRFHSEEEAAKAFDAAARRLRGGPKAHVGRYRLNFPTAEEQTLRDNDSEQRRASREDVRTLSESELAKDGWRKSGSDWLGRGVCREFDGEVSSGQVLYWLPESDQGDEALWKIQHDDGDTEDLDEEELKSAHKLYLQREAAASAPRPKKPESKDDWEWVRITKPGSGLDGGYWGNVGVTIDTSARGSATRRSTRSAEGDMPQKRKKVAPARWAPPTAEGEQQAPLKGSAQEQLHELVRRYVKWKSKFGSFPSYGQLRPENFPAKHSELVAQAESSMAKGGLKRKRADEDQSKVEHSIEAESEDWDSLWRKLSAAGWRKEDGRRIGIDVFYVPPGVVRGAAGSRCRTDYFDSKTQVRGHLKAQQSAKRAALGAAAPAKAARPKAAAALLAELAASASSSESDTDSSGSSSDESDSESESESESESDDETVASIRLVEKRTAAGLKSSPYAGVHWHATGRRWRAQAYDRRKGHNLMAGMHKDEQEAARAHDTLQRRLLSSCPAKERRELSVRIKLNFPTEKEKAARKAVLQAALPGLKIAELKKRAAEEGADAQSIEEAEGKVGGVVFDAGRTEKDISRRLVDLILKVQCSVEQRERWHEKAEEKARAKLQRALEQDQERRTKKLQQEQEQYNARQQKEEELRKKQLQEEAEQAERKRAEAEQEQRELQAATAWLPGVEAGERVRAIDRGKWYEAKVLESERKRLKIHFQGWGSKYDTWVPRSASRLRPLTDASKRGRHLQPLDTGKKRAAEMTPLGRSVRPAKAMPVSEYSWPREDKARLWVPEGDEVRRRVYEACVAKLVASKGAEHQDTLTARMNLALLLKSQGELDEALAMLQDVVTKRTSQLGTGHVDTLIAQLNLANLQAARGGESTAACDDVSPWAVCFSHRRRCVLQKRSWRGSCTSLCCRASRRPWERSISPPSPRISTEPSTSSRHGPHSNRST